MHRDSIAPGALTFTVLLLAACGRSEQPTSATTTAMPDKPGAHYSTTLDVKQVMNWVMDPNANIVFNAVATIVTEHGEEKVEPNTDAEWSTVRNSAAVILESGNLLMLPGRARPEGDWNEKAKALSAAAEAALQATDVKDPEALFTAAGDLYEACSACHARYVYADGAKAAVQ
jgi:hypothetical protein